MPKYFLFNLLNFAYSKSLISLNNIDSNIVRLLLAKDVSFCLYRFPFEDDTQIAVDPELLSHPAATNFCIAPFVEEASVVKNIYLGCIDDDDEFGKILEKLKGLRDKPIQWQQLPVQITREEYLNRLDIFLKAIREGSIKKAILSRVREIEKPGDFNPYKAFAAPCRKYPQAFVHLMYHPEAGMWIGATPELLLSADGDCFTTMALAGTQAARSLKLYDWGEKEKEEHQVVGQHIESVFAKHDCIKMVKNGPKTVEAGLVVHLQTNYEFYQRSRVALKPLLKDLHPTPAVGGWPVDKGAAFILANEGYDRKYYCGYLGETNFENKARLFINLRCMQIGENEIAIYCGGGITADSDPESEWEETVQKSLTMLNVVNERSAHEVV